MNKTCTLCIMVLQAILNILLPEFFMSWASAVKNQLSVIAQTLKDTNPEASYQPHKNIAGYLRKLYIKAIIKIIC